MHQSEGDSLAGVIGPPMCIIWGQNQVTPNLVLLLPIFFSVSVLLIHMMMTHKT